MLIISLHIMFIFFSLDEKVNVIQNQGFGDEIGSFSRFPKRAEKLVRTEVYKLSQQTTGIAIYFYTNSPSIKIQYDTTLGMNSDYISRATSTGADLYSKDSSGEFHLLATDSSRLGKSCEFIYNNINTKERIEFRLLLPNLNIVNNLAIGVNDGSQFLFIPKSPELPIVIYGTEIAQGACANKIGISWSSFVARHLEYPVQNYGFMNEGLLEPAVIDLIIQNKARVYILDCLPGLTNIEKTDIKKLIISAVKQIRANSTTPIILNDFGGIANAFVNAGEMQKVINCIEANQEAFDELIKSGVNDLYIQHFNFPYDSWIDTIHPLDIGMRHQAKEIIKTLRTLFDVPCGNISTQRSVTQNKFAQPNDWITRHYNIINWSRSAKPKAVIIGDSITNFWGGNPPYKLNRGQASWDKYFEPKGFLNLGIGTDRIENALWRIYHDELADNQLEKICILLGTNNFAVNTNGEIVEGLKFFCQTIQRHQPKAIIKVIGILPRRSMEDRVVEINKLIKTMAEEYGYTFVNPGTALLLENGKVNENMFVDGLHPNGDGYMKISELVAE